MAGKVAWSLFECLNHTRCKNTYIMYVILPRLMVIRTLNFQITETSSSSSLLLLPIIKTFTLYSGCSSIRGLSILGLIFIVKTVNRNLGLGHPSQKLEKHAN